VRRGKVPRRLSRLVLSAILVTALFTLAEAQLLDSKTEVRSAWFIYDVDTDENVGWFTSIALDSGGRPHMSHADLKNHDLKYATWTGHDWSVERVDSVDSVGLYSSLDLDSGDNPHISYHNSTGKDLKYARWNGTAWSIETIDFSGDVGRFTSLAVDSNDNPHISYFYDDGHDLKYSRWNGTAWVIGFVDSVDYVGLTSSITLDLVGNPHISYRDTTNGDLKYARWNGTSWSVEKVDFVGDVGGLSSIALDSLDNPHISYRDNTNGNLRYASKTELVPSSQDITLDIDPDTLNLKSKGRWITAYLSAENASVYDLDISSIRLQNTLEPERWDYQDDILMLKFNRQALIAILEVGESVEIKLSGKWKDGTDFEAYDYIRVINPGKQTIRSADGMGHTSFA